MSDKDDLTQLLVNLASAIRQLPAGREHDMISKHFIAVIAHLDSKNAIARGNWNVNSER